MAGGRGKWLGLALLAAGHAASAAAQAGDRFSAWDVQLLHGTRYAEVDVDHTISRGQVTFENASGWGWGSSYFFVECWRSYSAADSNATEVYGEWYPSASLRALAGKGPGRGLIRDVSLTLAVNAGVRSTGVQTRVLLPGVTVDFSVPGFKLLSLGAYAFVDRSTIDGHSFGADATGFQITPSWAVPFQIGGASFHFDGFADYISAHGESARQILTQPQLKLDLSALFGRPGTLLVGVEWQVWRNKYGVRGLNDNVPQALVLWNL